MTVAELLASSQFAHNQYRNALRARKSADAADWLMTAYQRRMDADTQDPSHIEAAWRDELPRFKHEDLVTFYREKLAI